MSKFYNLKIKEHKNGETQFAIYKNSIAYDIQKKYFGIRGQARYPKHSLHTSLQRTKTQIIDLAKNNKWELFITITFDKEKVDRYNYTAVAKRFSKLLNNIKCRKCPELKYILVPELHKDGAVHFHGLLSGSDSLELVDTGLKTQKGQNIYNILDFNLGFSTATTITDTKKASYYISKYITKELVAVSFNKKRFWRSRGLELPKTTIDYIDNEKDTMQLVSTLEKNSNSKKTVVLAKNELEIQQIKYFYM